MTLLAHNSVPAERAVGCTFAENFESAWHVQENGGVPSGTPAINFGATLNGTTDNIIYQVQGHEFNSPEISIVVEFYPDFDYDENVGRMLYDSTTTRYFAAKTNNAASNVLLLYLGNTSIAAVPSATYSPYWNVGSKNVFLISGQSGDTSAWLNGNLILANDATGWTPGNLGALYVGSNRVPGEYFDGVINGFRVFKSLLTAKEAEDYYTYGVGR